MLNIKDKWEAGAPAREERRIAREKAREEADRRDAERRRQAAEAEAARVANLPNLPTFVIQQIREVTVAAPTLAEALEIGKAAYKYGQDSDHLVSRLPGNATGDTVEKVRTIQVAAVR